jgi:multidrug efflux pump subunit AcrA (membrane-fusion protein)
MSALPNPSPQPFEKPGPSTAPTPHEPAGGGSKAKWIVLVLVAIAGVAAYQMFGPQGPSGGSGAVLFAKTTKVETGSVDQKIRISGQTASGVYQNITTPRLRGQVREMTILTLVPTGTRVRKGDVLLTIDTKVLEENLDSFNDALEAADIEINRRKATEALENETLAQQIKVAKTNLDKAMLDAKPSALRTTVQQQLMALSIEEAKAKHEQQLASVPYSKQSQQAAMTSLQLRVGQTKSIFEKSKADLSKFKITSPMDGLAIVQSVYRGNDLVSLQVGDSLSPGQLIVKVVDPQSMLVNGMVNQADNDKLRIGQPAEVLLDAFPGLRFNGKVHSIGALATSSGGRSGGTVRTVPVVIKIQGSDPRLIPDLSASADVLLSSEKDARILPRSALLEADGKNFVFVKTQEGFKKREVTVGAKSATTVAIKEGLTANEEVALQRPSTI